MKVGFTGLKWEFKDMTKQFIPQVYKIDTDRYILVMSGEHIVKLNDILSSGASGTNIEFGCLLDWMEEAILTSQPQEYISAVVDAKIRGAE